MPTRRPAIAECCMFGCKRPPEALVFNKTTSDMNERWYSCMDHVTRIIAYIVDRDRAWGRVNHKVVVQEISRA